MLGLISRAIPFGLVVKAVTCPLGNQASHSRKCIIHIHEYISMNSQLCIHLNAYIFLAALAPRSSQSFEIQSWVKNTYYSTSSWMHVGYDKIPYYIGSHEQTQPHKLSTGLVVREGFDLRAHGVLISRCPGFWNVTQSPFDVLENGPAHPLLLKLLLQTRFMSRNFQVEDLSGGPKWNPKGTVSEGERYNMADNAES